MASTTRLTKRPSFLVIKLGEWTAARLAEHLVPMGLRPRHLGVLQLLSERSRSQLELARALGVAASVVVDMIDELQGLGAVRRDPDALDRRRHSLALTDRGRTMLDQVERIAREVDEELLAGLDPKLRRPLTRGLRELGRGRGILADVTKTPR